MKNKLSHRETKRNAYKAEIEAILAEIEQDDFERKFIPIENEMWRDGYINGYIIGREKTQSKFIIMKNLFITMLILIILAWAKMGHAQTKVVKDAKGNYVAVKAARDTAHFTGHTLIDSKLKEWPVYISANDKMYYLRTSKAGNVYKVYIKED